MLGTIETMLRHMKEGVYDYTQNGECSGCGQCCSDILPLSQKEIVSIKRYIKKNGIKAQKHFIPTADGVYFDMTCPFRSNSEHKCMIYEIRPLICRDFRCDKPKQGKLPDKRLIDRSANIVSMRRTFFE